MNTERDSLELKAIELKKAQQKLFSLKADEKNAILTDLADAIRKSKTEVLEANAKDCESASLLLAEGKISRAVFNRLKVSEEKFSQLSVYPETISKLEDPVGDIEYQTLLDENLVLSRVRVPIGLIAVIFESRPEVVIQISSLMIKSSNAVFLKGGKETKNTNAVLASIVCGTLEKYGLAEAVVLLENREEIGKILDFEKHIDLIIPRGGNELVSYVMDNTRIPVLGHRDGICHIFIDESSLPEKFQSCILDAKVSYPSACNAVETLLIHENAKHFLPSLLLALKEQRVEIIGDKEVVAFGQAENLSIIPADDMSWATEYCDLKLNVKVVQDLAEAITHINEYGSGHTDSIFTENEDNAQFFMNSVDSANVFHNASTRFADGFVYGLGAEVGISCEKIHARGPVGIDGLMTTKYFLRGDGHKISDFRTKKFLHKRTI